MTPGVVKLIFEEKGSNYLIYRLSFNEEAYEQEYSRWNSVAEQLSQIRESLSRLSSLSDNHEAWSSHAKILEQFEAVKYFIKNSLLEPLEKIAQAENLEKYRDVGSSYKSLKQVIEKNIPLYGIKSSTAI